MQRQSRMMDENNRAWLAIVDLKVNDYRFWKMPESSQIHCSLHLTIDLKNFGNRLASTVHAIATFNDFFVGGNKRDYKVSCSAQANVVPNSNRLVDVSLHETFEAEVFTNIPKFLEISIIYNNNKELRKFVEFWQLGRGLYHGQLQDIMPSTVSLDTGIPTAAQFFQATEADSSFELPG